MEKLKRTIFFWTLVVLFFIVTPAIVLNAWGYRFDLNRGVFVHSGTITLKTNPHNFDVYTDGKLESSKTLNRINNSFNLTGLLPKSYNMTISADGFQSWSKTAEVHSGISTEFWNVLLARNNYEKTAYGSGGAEKFFISPKNDHIAFVRHDDSGTSVGILRMSDKAVINTFSFSGWKFMGNSDQENIEWSPDGSRLSVPLAKNIPTETTTIPSKALRQKNAAVTSEKKTESAHFIIDLNSTSETSRNLNEFLEIEDIKDIRWDPQSNGIVFFTSENSLYRANVSDKTAVTKIADDVSSYDLSKDGIYLTQASNELVFRTSLDGKTGLVQVTSNFPEPPSFPNHRLIVYDDARISFLNSNKNLYIYNRGDYGTYFKKIGSDIEGMQFSNDGKKLLFWSNNEISVYFLRQWKVQPTRNENELQNITRYADSIKNVQWFTDYEHVIFSSGPYVKIIELDARDRRISMELFKTDLQQPFLVYNSSLEKIFFADKDSADMSDLHSINFPEPGGFLGIFPPAQ